MVTNGNKAPFSIKEYHASAKPHLKYQVVGIINGKRRRWSFRSKLLARQCERVKNMEAREFGLEAAMLPEADRVMFRQSRDLLEPLGKTVLDAARDYRARHEQNARSSMIEKMCDEIIAQKRQSGYSARYICTVQVVARHFVKKFGQKLASEISTRNIDDFLGQFSHLSPVTRNHYRRIVVIFFSYAQEAGYCANNVAAASGIAREIPSPPGILQPEELARLLAACCPKILASEAIGAFAGVRTAERARLNWREVDLESGYIEVTAANAKSSRRRLVKIVPCLAAWLRLLAKRSGRVMPFDEDYYFELRAEAQRRAGLSRSWPKNALRHSYASYHLAHFKDAAALALEMGHKSQNVIFSNYREVVRPRKAEEYWQLAPFSRPELSKIYAFTAEAYPWFREVAGTPDKDGCVSTVVDLSASLGVKRTTISTWLSCQIPGCPGPTPDGRFHLPTWKKFTERRLAGGPWRRRLRPRASLFYVRCPVATANGRYWTAELKCFSSLAKAEAWAREQNQKDLACEIHLEKINNVIEFTEAVGKTGDDVNESRFVGNAQ